MSTLTLCGYGLAARGLRLTWADVPYQGYDRELTIEPGFDFFQDDGTELWRLQHASLDRHVYSTSVDEVRSLRDAFATWGRFFDVLRVRVYTEAMMNSTWLRHLPDAIESPDAPFTILGFDCGWLLGRHSAIYQPGFMERQSPEVRASWATRVNGNGLFSHIRVCQEFRALFYTMPDRESGDFEILEVAQLES